MNHVHDVASDTPNRNNAQHPELNVENVDKGTILPEYVVQRQDLKLTAYTTTLQTKMKACLSELYKNLTNTMNGRLHYFSTSNELPSRLTLVHSVM